jgi:hypothetical protein
MLSGMAAKNPTKRAHIRPPDRDEADICQIFVLHIEGA